MLKFYFITLTQKQHYSCREVLASEAVLNIPTRADWKECKQSREEEEENCKHLRDDFQPYDFAWDD